MHRPSYLRLIMISFILLLLLLTILPIDGVKNDRPLSITRYRRFGTSSSSKQLTAFGNPKYYSNKLIKADKPGVMLKVPNFDVLFEEICKVCYCLYFCGHGYKCIHTYLQISNSNIFLCYIT